MSDNNRSVLERLREKTGSCWGTLKDFFLTKRLAGTQVGEEARLTRKASRREVLGKLGALPSLGMLARQSAQGQQQEQPGAAGAAAKVYPEGLATNQDLQAYARLKVLDLDAAFVVDKQKKMPVGKIGDLTIGRLISGSNLINMNMHARDLAYVRALATHYATEGRMFMTLKKLEEHGVNTFVLKANNFRLYNLRKYKTEWGGKLQWIADVIAGTNIDNFEKVLVEHLELGASAAYLWGGSSDQWWYQKKPGNIVKAYEIMRKYKIPTGIGAHRLEPIKFCEDEGLKPDFYFLTFHHDRYWSAHPRENRRFIEMFEKDRPEHDQYHDNMFHHDVEATAAFMQNVKVPWIAFKVLAAGAIPPEDGFRYAFHNGADFICVGMFDWQVEQDVEIARKCISEAKDRKRPWFGMSGLHS